MTEPGDVKGTRDAERDDCEKHRAPRPIELTWARRLWVAAGVVIIALGVLGTINEANDFGFRFAPIAITVLVLAIGLAYILFGLKICSGDVHWRSPLTALTIVVAVMVLAVTIGFQSWSMSLTLVPAVAGLIATVLAYRPRAEEWLMACEPPRRSSLGIFR